MEKIFPSYAETTMQPVANDPPPNPGTTPEGRAAFARKSGEATVLGKPGESEDARFGRQMFKDMSGEDAGDKPRPTGGPALPDNTPGDLDVIPTDPGEYGFDLPESLKEFEDSAQTAEFLKFAKEEVGLTKKQFSKLMNHWKSKAEEMIPSYDKTESLLKKEWGGGVQYERNVEYARHAMEAAGDRFKSYLDATPAGNDPELIRGLAAIGRKLAAAYGE